MGLRTQFREWFRWLLRMFVIVQNKTTARQFLLFSSVLVGLSSGLAAIFLKQAVHTIHHLLTGNSDLAIQAGLYVLFPAIGLVLTVFFVQKYLKGKLEKGTWQIIYAIWKKSGFITKENNYVHIITSGLTVGFGGSAGLESPIVNTGASIGSNFARTHKLSYNDRNLLLACGAAAGIAAAFNAPIAGVLFALEVLLSDAGITAFIPLIIAAASGAIVSRLILDETVLLSFHQKQSFDPYNVFWYILLGVLSGFFSVYHTRLFIRTERFIQKLNIENPYQKALSGGILLAVLILIFPALFGEGYEAIRLLADQHAEALFDGGFLSFISDQKAFVYLFMILLLFAKTIAVSITLGSGGNGGNFAPSLFIGACLGYVFAQFLTWLGFSHVSVSNFTLVAMAGILSGVFHAPLTGIFLIAELTGGYELMIPLMIVSACSFMMVRYLEPMSIEQQKIASLGLKTSGNRDEIVLSSMHIHACIESDFISVQMHQHLSDLIDAISKSKRNLFPVLNQDRLVGIIQLDHVRDVMFKPELYQQIRIKQLMRKAPAEVDWDENMSEVMRKFDETGAWNLPVIHDGKYVGFISKSTIFNRYRDTLVKKEIG